MGYIPKIFYWYSVLRSVHFHENKVEFGNPSLDENLASDYTSKGPDQNQEEIYIIGPFQSLNILKTSQKTRNIYSDIYPNFMQHFNIPNQIG